ncbi:hypothetical protein PRZ48_003874 [Zasmidium cellare]|uniref:Xylanolytic transcriptional activator regulatory domain-containing protein n=1 Tax=Zasmidium cellare TaxID=395010 RepID=A0ABR0EWA8_ZASCE|nr:hypothetical protein PRZ48_003874 [Zasmidium cellare]
MAMELTFVNQYGDKADKASANGAKDGSDNGDSDSPHGSNATPRVNGTPGSHRTSNSGGVRRFISDLNPEVTFLQRPTRTIEPESRQQNDDIGIWVDKREWDELIRQKNSTTETAAAQATALNNQRPHSAVLGPLIDIYFRKVHPILPLLDEAEFRKNHAGGIVPEPLAHAICLVAAKDAEAAPHLRLSESDTPLAPRDFCSRLHASVMATLKTPDLLEKITLIRILALASLHPEGQDGAEDATMCLNKAMHYTQTLGWHLGQQQGVASGDDLATKRLFWCLWSLDRINGCLYGRPVIMSDEDIAIEPFEQGESGFPAFEAWLFITRMLNKIIGFYRPGQPITCTGWESDYFPSFEEALDEGHAWNQPQSTLATLHLFYLVTAMLSHRSRGVKYMPRSTPSYVRQSLCSLELIRLMSSHLYPSLNPLPILPYAISLSLSVTYQRIRQSQLKHQQEDAREDFRTCCQILQSLRRCWSSADVISVISKKVLDQLNKTTDLSSFRVDRFSGVGRDSPGICTASLVKPHTIIDHPDDGEGNAIQHSGTENPDPNAVPAQTGFELFEGMDDIFQTYMDPNYPVNLDDFSFLDDTSPLDWNAALT